MWCSNLSKEAHRFCPVKWVCYSLIDRARSLGKADVRKIYKLWMDCAGVFFQGPQGQCGVPRVPVRTYSMHGGAGALLSIGLFKAIPFQQFEDCVTTTYSTGKTPPAIMLWGIKSEEPIKLLTSDSALSWEHSNIGSASLMRWSFHCIALRCIALHPKLM